MSDLQPRGIPVTIAGVERHFLFTFAAIDEIQDHFDKPLPEIIGLLSDERMVYKVSGYIVTTLINDEIVRNDGKGKGAELMQIMRSLDLSMLKYVVTSILKAYGVSVPEPDEEDDDGVDDDPGKLNIARLLHIGTTKLGYTEAEVFAMTPRKFFALYNEYLEINGLNKDTDGSSISDLP